MSQRQQTKTSKVLNGSSPSLQSNLDDSMHLMMQSPDFLPESDYQSQISNQQSAFDYPIDQTLQKNSRKKIFTDSKPKSEISFRKNDSVKPISQSFQQIETFGTEGSQKQIHQPSEEEEQIHNMETRIEKLQNIFTQLTYEQLQAENELIQKKHQQAGLTEINNQDMSIQFNALHAILVAVISLAIGFVCAK